MTRCIDCNNLKSHGAAGLKMAKQGFGGCKHKPTWIYQSLTYERECMDFEPAPADAVEKRERWAA